MKRTSEQRRARRRETRRSWLDRNVERVLVNAARARAKLRDIPFEIGVADLPPMGTHCPILGLPFTSPAARRARGATGPDPLSPSLDRIDPSRGYVRGNVWIIGFRANRLKDDGTAEEHEAIAAAMRAAMAVG